MPAEGSGSPETALLMRLRPLRQALLAGWNTRAGRIVVVGVVLAVAGFSAMQRFLPQAAAPCTTDFASYYYSAVAVDHGQSPYGPLAAWMRAHPHPGSADPYTDTSCLHGILESTYTPFFSLLLTPFTWVPFGAALVLWDELQLALLAGAIYAFLRAARLSSSWTVMLLLLSAAVVSGPARFALYWAQADFFFLFCLCAAIWARIEGRMVLACLLLAAVCASEPAMLALLVFFLWKRELRLAAGTLAVSAALILAPFLVLGGRALSDLFTIWGYYTTGFAFSAYNNAPTGVLRRLLTPNPYVTPLATAPGLVVLLWLLVSLVVLVVALALIARRPLGSDSRSLLDLGLALAALLLMSPWSQNNKFTLLIVALLALYVCVRRIGWQTRAGRALLCGLVASYFLLVVLSDPLQAAFVARMDSGSQLAYVYVLLAAVYLYPLAAIVAVTIYAQRFEAGPREHERSEAHTDVAETVMSGLRAVHLQYARARRRMSSRVVR